MARWSRPETTVTDPDGQTWELYVGRPTGVRWRPGDYDELPYEWDAQTNAAFALALLEVPLFLYHSVLAPAARYVCGLPAGLIRSRRSTTWIVEAVSWWPHEQRFQWSVEASERDRVTAEITRGIVEGRSAQPAGAVFHGEVTR